jgi:diguanylate cyclase (GGDEF)-like protein
MSTLENQHLPAPHDLYLPSGMPQAVEQFPVRPEEGAVYLTPPMYARHSEAGQKLSGDELMEQMERRIGLLQDVGHAAASHIKFLKVENNTAKLEKEEAAKEALTDELTGLKNRRALMAELAERLHSNPGQTALAFIDLDNFKRANDEGEEKHKTGDKVLKKAADNMQLILREGEMLYRIGGDEFVAVLNKNPQGNKRRKGFSEEGFEKRTIRAVEEAAEASGVPFVSASVGIVNHRQTESAARLLARGDKKMYAVKQARKAAR